MHADISSCSLYTVLYFILTCIKGKSIFCKQATGYAHMYMPYLVEVTVTNLVVKFDEHTLSYDLRIERNVSLSLLGKLE